MGSYQKLSKHSLHSEPKENAPVEKSGHGEAAANEHGGGSHGEVAANEQGGGGHGEAGHGKENEKRETASIKGMVPFLSLDEIFANINQEKNNHTLALKVDVEFFDSESKQAFKTKQPAVKNLIIQTSREQEYDQLASLSGKLYYKELLIRRINEYFNQPLVKDIHFV
ncbi:hypothetical protein EBT16_06370, partial [bacterium]|nr:hypothetical protein [bacterium]